MKSLEMWNWLRQKCGRWYGCVGGRNAVKTYFRLSEKLWRKRQEQPPVRSTEKALGRAQSSLMDGTAVKDLYVTFGESNKAYAPYPALITRWTGRKDIDWSEQSALWQEKALSTITAENFMQRILTRKAVWTWNTATKILRTHITNCLMKHSPEQWSRLKWPPDWWLLWENLFRQAGKTIPWDYPANRG